jgi:outer membrane receptor for ferrienterochelin and colicin
LNFLVIAPQIANAAEETPLGAGNFAIKVDFIKFTDDIPEKRNVNKALYIGFEGFFEVQPNLYLGGEIGYTHDEGEYQGHDTQLNYIPFEVNLKYAFKLTPNLVLDIGAGISYNYIDEDQTGTGFHVDDDDWLFGTQVFMDLNWVFDKFLIGLNVKYKGTEDFDSTVDDYGYNSWRLGGQIGMRF